MKKFIYFIYIFIIMLAFGLGMDCIKANNISPSVGTYSCTYRSDNTQGNLKLTNIENKKWIIDYNGTTKELTETELRGKAFPTKNCEEVFYIESSGEIFVNLTKDIKKTLERACTNHNESDIKYFCPVGSGKSCASIDITCGTNHFISPSVGTYSCTYRGVNTQGNLKLTNIENKKWIIDYNGTTKELTETELRGKAFPTKNCEDILYIESSGDIFVNLTANIKKTLERACTNHNESDIKYFCPVGSGKSCSSMDITCDLNHNETEKCDLKDIPIQLPIFISRLINLFKIIAPIILVITGLIDFLRAVIASDEKQMKESQNRFIRRIVAAVFIFFIIAIVQFVINAISKDGTILGCFDCFISGNCE